MHTQKSNDTRLFYQLLSLSLNVSNFRKFVFIQAIWLVRNWKQKGLMTSILRLLRCLESVLSLYSLYLRRERTMGVHLSAWWCLPVLYRYTTKFSIASTLSDRNTEPNQHTDRSAQVTFGDKVLPIDWKSFHSSSCESGLSRLYRNSICLHSAVVPVCSLSEIITHH